MGHPVPGCASVVHPTLRYAKDGAPGVCSRHKTMWSWIVLTAHCDCDAAVRAEACACGDGSSAGGAGCRGGTGWRVERGRSAEDLSGNIACLSGVVLANSPR